MAYFVKTKEGLKGPIGEQKIRQLFDAGRLKPKTPLFDRGGEVVSTVSRLMEPLSETESLDMDSVMQSLGKTEAAPPPTPPKPSAPKIDMDDIIGALSETPNPAPTPPSPTTPKTAAPTIDMNEVIGALSETKNPAPTPKLPTEPQSAASPIDMDDIIGALSETTTAPAQQPPRVSVGSGVDSRGVDLDSIVDSLAEDVPEVAPTPARRSAAPARRSRTGGAAAANSTPTKGARTRSGRSAVTQRSSRRGTVDGPVKLMISVVSARISQVLLILLGLLMLGMSLLGKTDGATPFLTALGIAQGLICFVWAGLEEWFIRSLRAHKYWAWVIAFLRMISMCLSILFLPIGLFGIRELKRAEHAFRP